MKSFFVLLALVFCFILSVPAMAQNKFCQPDYSQTKTLFSCLSVEKGQTLYYSIELDFDPSTWVCSSVSNTRQAHVSISDAQGHILKKLIFNEGEYGFGVETKSIYFSSRTTQLLLLNCLISQGNGTGGISFGN